MVKSLPANAGDTGSIPGLGRSPGAGNGNPLQYSCLENPMDRGVWRAVIHRVTKSLTQLKGLSTHTHLNLYCPLKADEFFLSFFTFACHFIFIFSSCIEL